MERLHLQVPIGIVGPGGKDHGVRPVIFSLTAVVVLLLSGCANHQKLFEQCQDSQERVASLVESLPHVLELDPAEREARLSEARQELEEVRSAYFGKEVPDFMRTYYDYGCRAIEAAEKLVEVLARADDSEQFETDLHWAKMQAHDVVVRVGRQADKLREGFNG